MTRPVRIALIVAAAVLLCGAAVGIGWSLWYEVGTSALARAEQNSLRSDWDAQVVSAQPSGRATLEDLGFPFAHEGSRATEGFSAEGGPGGTGSDALDRAGTDDGDAVIAAPVGLGGDGSPVAAVRFHRPGQGPLISDRPFIAVHGVAPAQLRGGVGYYPSSAQPGHPGNFALAGHRTTHARPFADLDVLRAGDEIVIQDTHGRVFTYVVTASIVTDPADTSVLSGDPLGVDHPTITLTTCHPRGSARQRLVVFGMLRDDHLA